MQSVLYRHSDTQSCLVVHSAGIKDCRTQFSRRSPEMVAPTVCRENHSLMPSSYRRTELDIKVVFIPVRKNVHDITTPKMEMPCDIGSDVNPTGR